MKNSNTRVYSIDHNKIAEEWSSINWENINSSVKKLRGKIFQASKNNNYLYIHHLQNIMLHSDANLLIAIRRVTSINVGKRTPGIDHMLIKTNEERWKMFLEIKSMSKKDRLKEAKPVKRIYIPKPNGKIRPLGIPTIKDRVLQATIKNALEPEWEARFESSSYGFRPKRSAQDALARVWLSTARQKVKLWALDADIEGCFDNIAHEEVLRSIGNFPEKEMIQAWLKAGYCEFPFKETATIDTPTGTPQGGIISPLLANIALHGMEKVLGIKTVSTTGHNYSNNEYSLVRYADDFIVLGKSRESCERAKRLLEAWLLTKGLKFAPEKVHIRHLSEGIKFLGCQVRLYGKKDPTLLIQPHPDSITKFKNKLKAIWLKNKSKSPHILITELNPVIRGWANYFRAWSSSDTYSSLDNWIWRRSWRYGVRRHPMKGAKWVMKKYFRTRPGTKDKWSFVAYLSDDVPIYLLKMANTKIIRHVIVKNNMVPDDPNSLDYWYKRDALKGAKNFGNYESRLKIARRQYHICPICMDTLYNDEALHLHHIRPKKLGGVDSYGNLVLLHELCHRQAHSITIKEEDMRKRIRKLRNQMSSKLSNYKIKKIEHISKMEKSEG
jgi:RNA-directed DNA polymerase